MELFWRSLRGLGPGRGAARGALAWVLCSALFTTMWLPSCGQGTSGPELRILAAASLRDVLDEIGDAFEESTGTRVTVVTGGSNLLANQVLAGAKGDIFISAGVEEVERLQRAGKLQEKSRPAFFYNRLAIIVPAEPATQGPGEVVIEYGAHSAAEVHAFFEGVEHLSIAHSEAVPAGRYARKWLESLDLWKDVEPKVVQALDVRAALAAVESGGVDAGIVYLTDALGSDLVRIALPRMFPGSPLTYYSGGVLVDSEQAPLATSFLHFLEFESDSVVASHGFTRQRRMAE